MNYLELVRDVYRESGESFSGGATATTADSSVISYDSLVAGWVNQAWLKIQYAQKYWKWMWSEFTLTLNTSDSDYTLPTPVGTNSKIKTVKWEDTPFLFADNKYSDVLFLPYNQNADEFRKLSSGKPSYVTQLPNDKIRFNAIPDASYVFTGSGWREPWELVNNTDTPDMPVEFHKLIVYVALTDFVRWEAALDIFPLVMEKRQDMFARLMSDQLPDFITSGPMA